MKYNFKCLLKIIKRVEKLKGNKIIKFLLNIRWILILWDMVATYVLSCGVLSLLYWHGYIGDEIIDRHDFIEVSIATGPILWCLYMLVLVIFQIRRYKRTEAKPEEEPEM